ncbi:MAG: outer membrane beta-barrel protein, partial [Coxiellaceae bacterium]|nr:outer membrane beta-barrel protein [Coxiellaceae bacterium]
MSVKRYLTLAAAGIASIAATSAIAGGPDVMAAPMDYSGFYLDLDAGWGGSNWNHFAGGVLDPFNPSIGSVTDHGTGGFAWGGDVGYQFNQYFSVEMGAYDLASVRGNNGIILGNAASVGGVKINSWVLYAAGKVAIPVMQNFDFFGKVGVAWRFLNYSGVGVSGAAAIAAG